MRELNIEEVEKVSGALDPGAGAVGLTGIAIGAAAAGMAVAAPVAAGAAIAAAAMEIAEETESI